MRMEYGTGFKNEWICENKNHYLVYLCRLWTPPSIWADAVLFSNFRSPEYINALRRGEQSFDTSVKEEETVQYKLKEK